MARFDVYRFGDMNVPMVVDAQASLLETLKSRVVIPLVPETTHAREQFPRLKPMLMITSQPYILVTTDLTAVSWRQLGLFVENIEARHGDEIIAALDFLFSGF